MISNIEVTTYVLIVGVCRYVGGRCGKYPSVEEVAYLG